MNWMIIAVAAVLIGSTVLGARKGLLRQALSLCGALICLFLVSLLLPYTQSFIREHTAIEQSVSDKVDHMTYEQAGADEEQLAALPQEQRQEAVDQALDSKEKQNELIKGSDLPQFLRSRLIEHNNKEIYKRLGVERFTDYVKAYLTALAVKALAYVLSFVLAFVIFKIILYAAHIVDHLPLARSLNKALGALFGLCMGVIVIGLFFALLIPLCGTDFGKACYEQIDENALLTYLYVHNPILAVIAAFTG